MGEATSKQGDQLVEDSDAAAERFRTFVRGVQGHDRLVHRQGRKVGEGKKFLACPN